MKKIFTISFILLLSNMINAQINEQHTLQHNSVMREYTVHLPPGFDTSQTLPLVINMHGMGGDINSHMFYTKFNIIADTGNFIVVYPQGLTGTTSWGQTATQWDSYFGTGTKDIEFLDTLIDQMYYDYGIDLKRVYSTGHSNGGYMSYRLACELSERVAAIASVAGAMTFQQESNCNISHPMPILQIHGTADGTVPFNGVTGLNSSIPDLMNYWKAKNNCTSDSTFLIIPNIVLGDSSTATITDFSNCDSFSQVQLYTVINGGHSWPGAFDYPPLGNTCQDFNASSVIWNFFNQYQLDNPTVPEDTSITLNVELIKTPELEVFPNPFDKFITIYIPDNQNVSTLRMLNLIGEEMDIQFTKNKSEIRINGNELKKGIYFIYLENRIIKVIK